MKKTLIVILLVVFLLNVIVPAVFAAAPHPKEPNPNKDCFGEIVSNLAQNPDIKNYGEIMKYIIQTLGWSVSEVIHNTQACR